MLNCDRDSQGDVVFADMGLSVVRPRCFDAMEDGLLPQRWMGRRIAPIESWGGCDVDYEWQPPASSSGCARTVSSMPTRSTPAA